MTDRIINNDVHPAKTDIRWYKNVTNNQDGQAYLNFLNNTFTLHFPTKHRKNALSPAVDEIILLGQNINGIHAFTHLVTPINNSLIEDENNVDYRFGRQVRIIASKQLQSIIPVSSTLWESINFSGISQGNACRIENIGSIDNISELQNEIWGRFTGLENEEVNQDQRAYLCWMILTNSAKEHQLITYKQASDALGIHHRAMRFVLELIQDYCHDNSLPPLTILVVDQGTGKPGSGFTALEVEEHEIGFQSVFNENWDNIDNPFQYASDGSSAKTLVESIIESPDVCADVFARVKVRGAVQRIFRDALLKLYSNTCAFCGLSFVVALDASHIIPYAESTNRQKMDVQNGLLLCSTHHKLFDNKLIEIDEQYTMSFLQCDEKTEEYDTFLTTRLHGKKIRLPKNKIHHPKIEWLQKRQAKR